MKDAVRLISRLFAALASWGCLCLTWLSAVVAQQAASEAPRYRSPYLVAVSPDGSRLYISDRTAGCVAVADTASRRLVAEIALRGEPCGLCLSVDGRALYVAERRAGTVAVIDTTTNNVSARIAVDPWPMALALAPDSQRLYVGCQDRHRVCVVDVSQPNNPLITRIPVVREPSALAVTPDGKWIVVTNLLPDGSGTDPTLAAVVSLIDSSALAQTATVKLPPGSTTVQGVCLSPDAQWAYVVHTLGRFNLPITQLERGWVNTYALTIIQVPAAKRIATLLLDDLTQGAAGPFSVACAKDGSRLWISHAGTHEVSFIEIRQVHELLAGKVPESLATMRDGTQLNIWARIQQDPAVAAELENDLTALYIAGAVRRVASGGNGPRGLALSPDGQRLYVANYYAGTVSILDAAGGQVLGMIAVGDIPVPTGARRGEILFHDATLAFQRWHSCATCHPNQGRVDGLRWDFLRDGIGNGKDTISMVYVDETPPLNRRATRQSARDCARSSVEAGHMIVPPEQDIEDLYLYLKSLRPDPNPFLDPDGTLTESAERGRLLFETKADCVRCHPQPYYTDQNSHNVGILSPGPHEADGLYDTPALIEAHRTAPYLHDGRARTLRDVLTVHNQGGLHGKTAELNEQEIQDLEAYLLSL